MMGNEDADYNCEGAGWAGSEHCRNWGNQFLFKAIRTDTMAELNIGVCGNIFLHLLPVVLVISNLFTIAANRQQSLKLGHLMQGMLKRLETFG